MDRSKKILLYITLFLLALTAFLLNFIKFHDIGFGNNYYAAAVKSMLASRHNFFFASYDPGGFVSVDKPPLALWLQCAFAEIFGFKSWSILLPQALSSIASVFIIFKLVKKPFGNAAGLIAAFVLATTPIFVAVSRTNELDPVLVMIILFAAWAVNTAVQKGSLKWLLISMVLVGAGFNTKMAEAFMAIPAFFILYFFSSEIKMGRKLINIGVSIFVLIAVSLSWPIAVDLVPPEKRPYVGSSQQNSELNLAVGYNGINRVLPRNRGRREFGNRGNFRTAGAEQNTNLMRTNIMPSLQMTSIITPSNTQTAVSNVWGNRGRNPGGEGGNPGVMRLFNQQMAGQLSWLLPFALISILVFFIRKDKSGFDLQNPKVRGVLFWSAWILPMIVYFSITGFFHRYYLSMLAPGIAALCGIGVIELWENLSEKGWRSRLLPSVFLISALFQIYFLYRYPDWRNWMIPAVLSLTLISCGMISVLKLLKITDNINLQKISVIIGFMALNISPIIWSLTPMLYGDQASMPFAGPELKNRRNYAWVTENPNNPVNIDGWNSPFNENFKVDKLIHFLISNRKGEKFLIGVPNAAIASPIILGTGQPVMAMGGFSGRDNILTVEVLKNMVEEGQIRYFIVMTNNFAVSNSFRPRGNNFMGTNGSLNELNKWITNKGRIVKSELWLDIDSSSNTNSANTSQTAGSRGNPVLYDCRPQ